MAKPANHDAYIAAAPEHLRKALKDVRKQLARALADADEVIAYDMPGYRVGETIVAGYAAFKKQCGIYVSPQAIRLFADQLSDVGLKPTKTGVTFSPENPIPDELVRKLAQASREDRVA